MGKITGLHNSLDVSVVKDAKEATRNGFFYRPPIYKPVQVIKVVVVADGTESHKSTVDFILEDETGQKFVFMLTGKLLRSISTEFTE